MESKRASSRPLHDRSEKRRRVEHPHSSSHSTYGVPTSLNLGRKIFLSHSGKDKDFVCFLHDQLCRRYHDDEVAFFDQETLPKAKPISMENILEEARGSKLGVLVLTDDFFMHTPNPMLELEAFVAGEVQLLPLFFKMSVVEFQEESRRDRWEERWREWSAVDDRVQINEWRRALIHVKTFCGLEYGKIGAANHQQYIHKIVNAMPRIISRAVPFSEEGVCGKDRLCKIVKDMYKECASKRPSNDRTLVAASTSTSSSVGGDSGYTLDVVGIDGFAGLGKTTLCKCLCDFYFAEFNGHAYYVNLGSIPSRQASSQTHSSMRMLLSMLTGCNNDNLHSNFQVKNLLQRKFSGMTDPIFLAIDNILREWESQEEADFYLRCKFPKGSKIFITSRSGSILENIFSQHSSLSVVINYMPALEFKEARDIFVHEIPKLPNFGISNAEDEVNELVKMCTIRIAWLSLMYHPLMLKSLTAYIKWARTRNLDWKGRLQKLKSEGITDTDEAWKRVFEMLEITYEILTEEAKTLFLDLALVYNLYTENFRIHAWIQTVYSCLGEKKIDDIILQLQDLSFLEEGSWLVLPGVMVDFAKHKASQDNNYLVVEDNRELPRSAYRNVSISRSCARTLDMRHVEGVEVLHLVDNAELQEVLLSATTCPRLRSLIVRVPPGTSLRCTMDEDWSASAARRRMKAGPMWVELQGNVIFDTSFKATPQYNPLASYLMGENLQVLSLQRLPALQGIDLSSCASIRLMSLTLSHLPSLGFIRGLDKSANLRYLTVRSCEELRLIDLKSCVEAVRLSDLPSLEDICGLDYECCISIGIECCEKLRFIDLMSCVEDLQIDDREKLCPPFLHIRGCGELQELTIPGGSNLMVPKLSLIQDCKSLRSISICPPSSYVDCETTTRIFECHSLSNVDGLSQYTGHVTIANDGSNNYLEKKFRELLESAEIDSSICKATVKTLALSAQYLPGLDEIELEDAQHIGLFISAVFKEQTAYNLEDLRICCKRDGDCGCDKNRPLFGPLPQLQNISRYILGAGKFFNRPRLRYCCPQVRDLASIAQWHLLKHLDLSGCTSVEVWPDFATMTSLRLLDLSYTSLKEWPTGVLRLRDLDYLDVRGCRQLPAEEFIKVVTQIQQPSKWHSLAATLIEDLQAKRRDSCSIVDALDSHYAELIDLFRFPWLHFTLELLFLVKLLYDLWFGEGDDSMRRLLCSESFMSLSLYLLRRCTIDRIDEMGLGLSESFMSFGTIDEMGLGLTETKSCYMSFGLMAVALVGVGSIGCYNASVNEDLKDDIIAFVKWFNYEELQESTQKYPRLYWLPLHLDLCGPPLHLDPRRQVDWCRNETSPEESRWLKVRVGHAVCKMARVPSVAAELGEDFIKVVEASYALLQSDE